MLPIPHGEFDSDDLFSTPLLDFIFFTVNFFSLNNGRKGSRDSVIAWPRMFRYLFEN